MREKQKNDVTGV